MSLRVLGRVRISRSSDESTSVQRQREAIERWCEVRGYTLVGWAVDEDFSRSARPFEAPEFGPWLTDPEKVALWDVTVASRVDRFGAGWRLKDLYAWCRDHDKDLNTVSVDISLKSTMGRIIADLLAELGQGEWDAIQERVLQSRAKLRELGRWAGGKPPYWLKPVKQGPGYTLKLDPESSAVVERIIDEFLPPKSRPFDAIAADLNKDGVLASRDYYRSQLMKQAEARGEEYTGRKPEGALWRAGALKSILHNHALLGLTAHEGAQFLVNGEPVLRAEALVSAGRWNQIQQEFSRRSELRTPTRERSTGPLYGVLYCSEPDCKDRNGSDQKLHINRASKVRADGGKNEYRYYRSPCGHNPLAPADLVEDMVMSQVDRLLGSVNEVRRSYVPAEDHTAELEQAERAHEEFSTRLANAPTPAIFESLSRQLDGITARVFALSQNTRIPARVEYAETGRTYAEILDGATAAQYRDLMAQAGISAHLAFDSQGLGVSLSMVADMAKRLGLSEGQELGDGWIAGQVGFSAAWISADDMSREGFGKGSNNKKWEDWTRAEEIWTKLHEPGATCSSVGRRIDKSAMYVSRMSRAWERWGSVSEAERPEFADVWVKMNRGPA